MKRPANVEQWLDWGGRSRGWFFTCADCGSPGGTSKWQYRLTYPQVNSDGLAVRSDCAPVGRSSTFFFCSKCGGVVPSDEMMFSSGGFGSNRYPHHKGCPAGWSHGPEICEQCGASLMRDTSFGPMKSGRPDRRYCSTKCRVAAHRARRRVTAPAS